MLVRAGEVALLVDGSVVLSGTLRELNAEPGAIGDVDRANVSDQSLPWTFLRSDFDLLADLVFCHGDVS
jgi:hypothetical protein